MAQLCFEMMILKNFDEFDATLKPFDATLKTFDATLKPFDNEAILELLLVVGTICNSC